MAKSRNNRKNKKSQKRKNAHLNFGKPLNLNSPLKTVAASDIDAYTKDISTGLPEYQQKANREWAEMMKSLLKPGGVLIVNS